MQDAIAIMISVAAALWLVRSLWRQTASPSCGKAGTPQGTDGFVSLDSLTQKNRGGREAAPDRSR